jgi:hypothetical protein
VRDLAFACLNEAQMNKSYFPLALEHAWKLHAELLHKALTKTNGEVQCPLCVCSETKVSVSNFRVMFCPVVVTYDNSVEIVPMVMLLKVSLDG